MNKASELMRRTSIGIGLMAGTSILFLTMVAPGGAFEGRAVAIHIDEPGAEVTTTTTTAPVAIPVPAPVTTTTTAPPVAVPAPTTVTTETSRPAAPPLAKQGHYACTGDDNATADCINDETGPLDIPVNAGSDQPGATLGVTSPVYGARLETELCAVKPAMCP